jgi:sugar-specific transcriptional regulator TrmB
MDISKYIEKSLSELDLTQGEAKLYIKILQSNGYADASFLIKSTKYSSAGIYKLIYSLVDKGFITPSKDRPTVFTAIPLDSIAKKFAVKGRKLGRIANKFLELGKLSNAPIDTSIYEENDLNDFYLNIPYKINDFIWCIGSFEAVVTFFGLDIEKEFIKTRVKKGKFADAVIFDNSKYSEERANRDNLEKRETRIIAHNDYPLEFSYLFGNTILDFYKDVDGKVKVLKSDNPARAKGRLIQYQRLWNSTEK